MERYLAQKRDTKVEIRPPVKEEEVPEEEFQEEEEEFYSEKSFFQSIIDKFVGEEEGSGGIFASVKSVFRDEHGDVVMEEIEIEELPEDVKDVLKIVNKWLAQLPPDKMRQFKQSTDYKIYKETLRTYNLIK